MLVGFDMGGTHIDGVIIKDNKVINTIKKPTNRDDLFETVWGALKELLRDYNKDEIKRINLSTTISTNAIVENKVSSVGMIIQSGPGLSNELLACGDENVFISGYLDHRGVVVDELDGDEIYSARLKFVDKGIKVFGVVSKFSTRNPQNELMISQILNEDLGFVSLGHKMSGKLNFPRRVYTSYLNSAVHSTFNKFARNIKKSLEKEGIEAPIYILKADGGTMDMKTAEEKPVETVLSGPAASFMGLSAMLNTEEDAILLDIGGTTTDIFFLADGEPLFEPLGAKISKYKTLVRAIYSVSIGLGGDSNLKVKDDKLIIGPERKGRPYAFGGEVPTPTDAFIYLGLININEDIHKEKAKEAMELLGIKLNLAPEDIADLIIKKMAQVIKEKTDELLLEINAKPVYTIKELLHGKKIKPKSISLIGGPANILRSVLEKVYKLPCHLPNNYQVANAIGSALAKTTVEINMIADTSQGILTVPEQGIYESIPRNYSIDDAKERAIELIKESVISMGGEEGEIETEITEESSFNMVDGFSTTGKNIRIKAQIKPGHILRLRSDY